VNFSTLFVRCCLKDYFSTDPLTQSEAVQLGRALAKLEELNGYGKVVITFKLFEGKLYDSEDSEYRMLYY